VLLYGHDKQTGRWAVFIDRFDGRPRAVLGEFDSKAEARLFWREVYAMRGRPNDPQALPPPPPEGPS